MPSVSPSSGARSNQVLPSSMWPPHPDTFHQAVLDHENETAEMRASARSNRATADQLSQTTEGNFSEEGIRAYHRQAIMDDHLADIEEANGRAARTTWRLSYDLHG